MSIPKDASSPHSTQNSRTVGQALPHKITYLEETTMKAIPKKILGWSHRTTNMGSELSPVSSSHWLGIAVASLDIHVHNIALLPDNFEFQWPLYDT